MGHDLQAKTVLEANTFVTHNAKSVHFVPVTNQTSKSPMTELV